VLTDAELVQADEKARADALDVTRSFIIQAPAGSGKTELLIQRYLRLLAIVRQPEEILAITFTNKAASEMQRRVIEALRRARDGETPTTAHEKLTIAAAGEALEKDREYRWSLIDSPNRMRILTVDAFGAGIARSLPVSSGLGGTGVTLTDAGIEALYRDAAAATLDYLTSGDELSEAVERVLSHLDNNTSLYIDYLSRMLASREQWLSITGWGPVDGIDAAAARRALERNIRDVIDGQLVALKMSLPVECHEELLALMRYAAANLKSDGKDNHALVRFCDGHRLPSPEASERESWQAIANLLLIKAGDWRKSINKNDGFPAGDAGQKQRLYDLIASLQSRFVLRDGLDRARLLPGPQYTDAQWDVLLALFKLLPHAAGELRRLFSERGVNDHNEVALSANRALGDPEEPGDIAMILDYKVQHLLVDEMQDTSISQYEMLKKLTAGWTPGDGRSVFCVGDPMQSIYRFRDAEVGEFLLARKNGLGNVRLEPLLLRQNFRSGENLVHWFNTVFMQVMPTSDDVSIGAISYSESAPVEQHAGRGEYTVHPLFGADSKDEAMYTREVVRRCLADEGGITILVRSRTQLADLLPVLREAHIEYQAVEIDRLTDLPEIIDVLALTRAVVHRGDRLAWLALLRGPWVGMRWRDLHALVYNDTDRTILELCSNDEGLASLSVDGADRLRHFVSLMKPFTKRDGTRSLRDRIELAWFALGGPSILRDAAQIDNVYRFFSTIEKLEVAGSLEDVRELEQRLDDERVSSVVSANCRVQIMTMHKAKGLQFDHVVLPGLGRATRRSDRDVLSWLTLPDGAGGNEMIISPVGPRAEVENDALHRFIEATENDKSKMELDRLLYVACTRAIRSLHLIGSVGVQPDRESFRNPHAGSLLSRLWPAIEIDYSRAFESWCASPPDESTVTTREYLVNPSLRRLKNLWCAPNPPGMPGNHRASFDDAGHDDNKVEFYWVGHSARHAGTIVHRWLQRISDGVVAIDVTDPSLSRPLTRRWALDLGVSDDQIDDVCERTDAALAGILTDEKGRWVVQGDGWSELAVTGVVEGRIESIVIDRVRVDEEGTHWIIDYKTSTHEGGDLPGFLQQESERYRPQLQKYASLYRALTDKKIRTALYFPLLQEFFEVTF
jgi:ATP-dependent exoDNAse (exonuclease V) beta subunit